MSEVSLIDVYRARRSIAPYLSRTPLLQSRELGAKLGCDLWIKYEDCSTVFLGYGSSDAGTASFERVTMLNLTTLGLD